MLFLVPLFLVLGIMYSFISYELQTKELRWSVDQESRALGHTIQSFAEHNADRYFIVGADSQLALTPEIDVILHRILSQERMISVQVLSPDYNTIRLVSSDDYSDSQPDSSNSELLYESEFEGTDFSLLQYDDRSVLNINTTLNTKFGSIKIQMVKDAGPYIVKIQELRRWIFFEVITALALGIIVSLVLTYFIKKRINKLTEGARYFLNGNEYVKLDQGTISEFNDLGSTLNILVNVFHKNMDWYRKSIQQKEQDRTSIQLSQFIKESGDNPIEIKSHGLSIIAGLAGKERQHLFVAPTKLSNFPLIWGSIKQIDSIEALLLTEAVTDFIGIYEGSINELIKALLSIFGVHFVELNYMEVSHKQNIQVIDALGNHDVEVRFAEIQTSYKWIHSLDMTISEKIEMYTLHSQSLSQDQLFSDIRTLIGHIGSTVLIGIKRDQ